MQVVINKCFLLTLEKKIFGADPSYGFREKAHFNPEKLTIDWKQLKAICDVIQQIMMP